MAKTNLHVFSRCSQPDPFHWSCLKIEPQKELHWCDRRGSIWQGGRKKTPN